MKNLKELLKSVNEIKGKDDASKIFYEIALELFNNYEIRKGKEVYDFLEVEFYYYTDNHKDVITYPRTSEVGKWFFHQSGVDITFDSNSKRYGGILIRSLLKNKEIVITGPRKCEWGLFDTFDAFEIKENELPLIKKKEVSANKEVFKTQRCIPNYKDNSQNQIQDFEDFPSIPYRFTV
jgi:hypothetical protein